jgi:hypothetical protein
MTIFIILIVVIVLGVLLTNTKRWRGLASGARKAKRGFEAEIEKPPDDNA